MCENKDIIEEGANSDSIEYKMSKFSLSNETKIEYLNTLIGKMYKILHLIEEEKDTGFSPKDFIAGQLFEINAANALFDNKLATIIIKLKGIYDGYSTMPFDQCKKQIFEIKRIINYLLKNIEN